MFVSVTTDEEDHKKVLDFFGIEASEVPTYTIAKEKTAFFCYHENSVLLYVSFR
jgi:hypothetical protein